LLRGCRQANEGRPAEQRVRNLCGQVFAVQGMRRRGPPCDRPALLTEYGLAEVRNNAGMKFFLGPAARATLLGKWAGAPNGSVHLDSVECELFVHWYLFAVAVPA